MTVIKYDYNEIIKKLGKQRARIKATKEEIQLYIYGRFGKHFVALSDGELIDLGIAMSKANSVEDLFLALGQLKKEGK